MPDSPQKPANAIRLQASVTREGFQYETLRAVVGDFKEVIVEFMRTAVSNPATGWVLAVVTTDVLYRAKIIDQGTAQLVMGGLAAAFAVDVAVEAEGLLSWLFGSSSGTAGNTDLIKPVTSTVVQSPTAPAQGVTQGALGRMLALLGKTPTGDTVAASEAAIPAGALL